MFTSYEAKRGLFVARIFGCHASRVEDSPTGVDGGEFLLRRFVFDPLGFIWRSEYFGRCGRSSGCFRKQFSIKWLVIPLLM